MTRAPGLRIAALMDTHLVSGPGRQLTALARALAERGHELHVVLLRRVGAPFPPFAEFLAQAGVAHSVLDERAAFDLGVAVALRRRLRELAPDVVQTHSYKFTAIAALLRATGERWPWLAFFHGATDEDAKVRLYNRIDRWLLPRADRVVVMSRAHRESFTALVERVRVVYNAAIPLAGGARSAAGGPDLAPFRSTANATGAALLGVVGRLSPEKGVDVLLDALKRLERRQLMPVVVIVGDGPSRSALEARTVQLELSGRVHFVGPVTDVGAVYRQIDLLVLPSRSEGLPNVLLEGLLHDRPAVATAVGAVPEVLTTDDAGIVVQPDDAEALANGIVRGLALIGRPEAAIARATTARRFSLAHRVDSHLALYAELTGADPTLVRSEAVGGGTP